MLTSVAGWLSIEITYGLYLSDHSILDAVDTELVVLSGESMQGTYLWRKFTKVPTLEAS